MAKKKVKPANRHQRTRRDHATETAEDYVEAIDELIRTEGQCRVTRLACLFAVSHVTVSKTIARLQREGLVETVPHGPITLTEAGRKMAEKSRARHEIVLEFLIRLGVSPATAAIDSEGIEHHVSEETLERMRTFGRKRREGGRMKDERGKK